MLQPPIRRLPPPVLPVGDGAAPPGPSFFDGLSLEEVGRVLAAAERRRFPAGTVVLARGGAARELLVVRAGAADVVAADRDGGEHRIAQVGPGSTLGEMALLTGRPASATVRAATDLEALALGEADVHRAAAAVPRLYRNLGAILSRRLAATNRRAVRGDLGRVSLLVDRGAPPELGYALAASVAWHTRRPTVLLLVADELPADLAALATRSFPPGSAPRGRAVIGPTSPSIAARADVVLVPRAAASVAGALTQEVAHLRECYDHVLLQFKGTVQGPALAGRAVRLAGPNHDRRDGEDGAAFEIRGWTDGGSRTRPDDAGVLRVPALDPADVRALRAGLLPATTAAGRVLGWAARDLAGLKVGLALGAGSVKGYAHVGVLRVLERVGLPVDYLAGTSIGAAVAGMHALGHGPEAAAAIMDRIGGAAFRLGVPIRGLLSSAGLRAGVRSISGGARFEDLPVPLAVLAADIVARQEVVFDRGLLWPAVVASMSLPGIYPPQRIGSRFLVDGGVLNPVPADVTARMGADVVVAVKLANRRAEPATEGEGRVPSLLEVLSRSLDLMMQQIVTESAGAATTVIEPACTDVDGWGLRDFSQGRRFIEAGEAAAEAALPSLAAALPWLRG